MKDKTQWKIALWFMIVFWSYFALRIILPFVTY